MTENQEREQWRIFRLLRSDTGDMMYFVYAAIAVAFEQQGVDPQVAGRIAQSAFVKFRDGLAKIHEEINTGAFDV